MAFLIIDNDQNFADTLAANLLKEFGGEVHIKENASEAIALLELLDDFQFIIGIHSNKDENLADKILSFVHSSELERKPELIFLGGAPKALPAHPILLLPITTKVTELIQLLKTQKSYQSNLEKVEKSSHQEYAGVPLRLFYYVSAAPDDLYLKIKKDGEPHMVKRYSKKDALEIAELESFSNKGVRFFYVEKEKLKYFFEVFDKRLTELAQSAPDQFMSESDLENYAFHSLNKMGISESSLMVAQSASKEVAKKLDSEQQFQKAIKEIAKSKKLGLKQLNSKMIALISYFITKGSELDTTQIRSNMVMASILQDSKLSNEYAGIRSIGELQAQYLPDDDNILIDKHAALAAEHLDKFPSISSEVVKIVRHHHGSNEGKGFSTDLSLIKSIQSLVFILAEEISFAIIKRERASINLGEILEGISRKYDHHEKLDELIEQFKENL